MIKVGETYRTNCGNYNVHIDAYIEPLDVFVGHNVGEKNAFYYYYSPEGRALTWSMIPTHARLIVPPPFNPVKAMTELPSDTQRALSHAVNLYVDHRKTLNMNSLIKILTGWTDEQAEAYLNYATTH